jgi:uncharacterized surface anchored protein
MYSTPTTLGAGTATATGDVQINVVIPTGTTGQHTFVLYGKDTAGATWALTKVATVVAASSTSTPTQSSTPSQSSTVTQTTALPTETNAAPLPQTGAPDIGRILVLALLAVQAGLILLVAAARKPRPLGAHARRH